MFVQSVCDEEKEVYRQLLTMVSGGQSSFLHNGSSHAIVRSHRDLYVSNTKTVDFNRAIFKLLIKCKGKQGGKKGVLSGFSHRPVEGSKSI